MAWPAGVTLRTCSLGPDFGIVSGDDYGCDIVVSVSRPMMTWGATGSGGIGDQDSLSFTPGLEVTFQLPVTDQAGWYIGGLPIDVGDGQQSHVYTLTIKPWIYNSLGRKTFSNATLTLSNLAVPTGADTLDLDKSVATAGAQGGTVTIPDLVGQLQATVEASATDAAASASAAAASAQTAHDISNIDTSDDVVSTLVADPQTGPKTTAALNTAIGSSLGVAIVTNFGAKGDGVTDDLAAFEAAAGSLGTAGGTLTVPPGHYLLSDSLNLDAEWIKVDCAPDAIIELTSTASTGGHAVAFVGHDGAGTATTPQRAYCEWNGGTIISPLSGANENALGALRYKQVRVRNLTVPLAGRKAFTCQYGVNNIMVDGLTIGQTGNAAVSIEESCDFVGLNNISIDSAGRWGFYVVNATKVSMSRTVVKQAGDRAYFFAGCSEVHLDRFTVTSANGHGVEVQDGSGLFSFSRFKLSGIAAGFRGFYVHDNASAFAGELEIDKGTVDGAGVCNITATSAKRVAFAGVTARNVPAGSDVYAFNGLTVRPTLHRCRAEGTAHAYTVNAVSMSGKEPIVVACDFTAGASGKYGNWKPKLDTVASGITTVATIDPSSVAAGTTSETTVAVAGVALGDPVIIVPLTSPVETGIIWSAYVSSAGNVTIRIANVTGSAIDPAPRQWRVTVLAPA